MSAQKEGRNSPEPENQAGHQGTDAPSNAQGVSDGGDNKETNKKQLEELTSNPAGPLDAHREETAKKTVENNAGDLKFKD